MLIKSLLSSGATHKAACKKFAAPQKISPALEGVIGKGPVRRAMVRSLYIPTASVQRKRAGDAMYDSESKWTLRDVECANKAALPYLILACVNTGGEELQGARRMDMSAQDRGKGQFALGDRRRHHSVVCG
eukprot:506680_1